MGEKIRDIYPIELGNSKYMIELNKGYFKEEGDLIHIQNSHFRYLLTVKDFFQLSSTILRAKSEMDYYKKNNVPKSNKEDNLEYQEQNMSKNQEYIIDFMRSHNISFKIIENGDNYLTILVKDDEYKMYRNIICKNRSFRVYKHPFATAFNYDFLYQMKEFELFEYNGVVCEVYFQLPCMSLTPKTWIPLDKSIQSLVWKDDNENLNDICFYIYRLSWAIFKDKCFTKRTIHELEKHEYLLKTKELVEYLETVYFKYTDSLVEHLINHQYSRIIEDYFRFDRY